MHVVFEKCHYFRNDDLNRHKTQHMSCTMSWSSRFCLQNFAIVRRGVYEAIGHRQNKQTIKYLVDLSYGRPAWWATGFSGSPLPCSFYSNKFIIVFAQ